MTTNELLLGMLIWGLVIVMVIRLFGKGDD